MVLTTDSDWNLPIDAGFGISDPDGYLGEGLTYDAKVGADFDTGVELSTIGLSINSGSGLISGIFRGTGDARVIVRARDPEGLFVEDGFSIEANSAPRESGASPLADRVFVVAGAPMKGIDVGNAFADDDNGYLNFQVAGLSAGLTFDAAAGLITGTPSAGNTPVEIIVTDGRGGLLAKNFNIQAFGVSEFAPSTVVLTTGVHSRLPIAVSDWFVHPDVENGLTLNVREGLIGTGLRFDASSDEIRGPFIGTVDARIIVTATDRNGVSISHALDVIANSAPEESLSPLTDRIDVTTGSRTEIDLGASFQDRDGDTLEYLLRHRQEGLAIDGVGGRLVVTMADPGITQNDVVV